MKTNKCQNKNKEEKNDKGSDKKSSAKSRKVAARPRRYKLLRKVYQAKVLDWVVKSMEFEKEPVSMSRLKELLEKEKTALVR